MLQISLFHTGSTKTLFLDQPTFTVRFHHLNEVLLALFHSSAARFHKYFPILRFWLSKVVSPILTFSSFQPIKILCRLKSRWFLWSDSCVFIAFFFLLIDWFPGYWGWSSYLSLLGISFWLVCILFTPSSRNFIFTLLRPFLDLKAVNMRENLFFGPMNSLP